MCVSVKIAKLQSGSVRNLGGCCRCGCHCCVLRAACVAWPAPARHVRPLSVNDGGEHGVFLSLLCLWPQPLTSPLVQAAKQASAFITNSVCALEQFYDEMKSMIRVHQSGSKPRPGRAFRCLGRTWSWVFYDHVGFVNYSDHYPL